MVFDENCPAYIMTNEIARSAMKSMPKNCKRALVCAASGDQALFCSLHAALHYGTTITVDTFDITSNARAIMDIKTAAIQCLNRDEYFCLLEKIRRSNDVLNEPYMDKVSKFLSDDTYWDICSQKQRPFISGFLMEDKYQPNDSEYKKLQKIIKEPYYFIQTDIANLGAKLDDKMYDFIHLSNIFDHINPGVVDVWKIIYPLMEHVNVGGRILSYVLFGENHFSPDSIKDKKWVDDNILKNWGIKRKRVQMVSYGCVIKHKIVVFERVR